MMRSLIPTKMPRASDASRRTFLAGGAVYAGLLLGARPVLAFTVEDARSLIDRAIGEVNAIIAANKPEAQMLRDFEAVFSRYADVATIARSALGPAARQAKPAELAAYTEAFSGYIARKYGRRFREFIGGAIEVTGARPMKSYFEVSSVAKLRGQSPFAVDWHVSDRSGQQKFFNIIIEGVNMLAAERAEIAAMLNRRRGDIAALTQDLKSA